MENELRTNAVPLSPAEQYEIRKSIIRQLKHSRSNHEIAETLDVSERHVRATKKLMQIMVLQELNRKYADAAREKSVHSRPSKRRRFKTLS